MNWLGLWNYMKERENIRLKKEAGNPWPWTRDKILQTYKFTNVQRIHDRTTRVFQEIYDKHVGEDPKIVLYNCALYRYFGTAEWAGRVGWMVHHNPQYIIDLARELTARGKQIFTGAYVITNSGQTGPKYLVVEKYLQVLWNKAPRIVDVFEQTGRWQAAYEIMHAEVPGFGGSGFMAKEVLQDFLLWLPYLPHDYVDFTPIGPGARRGLNRVLGKNRYGGVNFKEGLAQINELRMHIEPLWAQEFPGNFLITAHDIQFCLCEFDKYERARLGQGKPRSKYHHGTQEVLL